MSSAEAILNQALDAFQRDDAQEAYRLGKEALAAAPEAHDTLHFAGVAALSAGEYREAVDLLGRALKRARTPQENAANWTAIGRAYRMLDDETRAEGCFRQALRLAPDWPPALVDLALSLQQKGNFNQAESLARRALELGESNVDIHNCLGGCLIAQEKYEEAERAFRAALQIEPKNLEARYGLANLAKIRGKIKEAEIGFRELLADEPLYPAYHQLAQLTTFETANCEEIQAMKAQLKRTQELPDAPLVAQGDIHYALFKAFEDVGDYDLAFDYLRQANAISRSRHSDYKVQDDIAVMERIETLFTPTFFRQYEGVGHPGVRPIFIPSLPRSGSTLTEQMIASHSQVRGGGELTHFGQVATKLSLKWGSDPAFPDLDPGMARRDLRSTGEAYIEKTAALRLLHPFFTDKSPINFYYIGLIHLLLPDAKIIHVRRHPLDCCFGMYRQQFTRGILYSYDLDDLARYYRAYDRLMQHWRHTAPDAFVEIYYEALVANPETELTRVLRHCGLEFEPHCLEFYKYDRPVRTASVVQVRQPLNRKGIGRWRNYQQQLAPLETELRDLVSAYEVGLESHQKEQGLESSPA